MNFIQGIVTKYKDYEHKQENKRKFKALLLQYASSGKFSQQERDNLESEKTSLELTNDDIKGFTIEAYVTAYQAAKGKGTITKEDEDSLQAMQTYLGIADTAISATKDELAHDRLLNNVQLGNIPVISVNNVVFHKDEKAYWSEPAALVEEKTIGRTYQGGSRGVSVHIMKGINYRVGASKGHIDTQKGSVIVSKGQLVITNQRVIFSGDMKSFAITIRNIINIQQANGYGMAISESGKSTARIIKYDKVGNGDLIAAILSYAVNHYQA